MKTYSAVLLDIDGTLADSKTRISANTKRLLTRLEKRGVPIVLCSSLAPSGVEAAERQAGLHGPIVCFGGSLILDGNRDILEDKGIGRETAVGFKRFAAGAFPDVTVCSYMYDVWLADDLSDANIQLLMVERGPAGTAVAGSLEAALGTKAHAHKLICVGPPQTIRDMQAAGEQTFPDLEFTRSGSMFLEVFCKRASRYTAMECIRNYYGLNPEEIVAVGGGRADIDMLRGAGLGVAMGNAPEEVRQAAKKVTTSNDEDGVYFALKSLRFTSRPL